MNKSILLLVPLVLISFLVTLVYFNPQPTSEEKKPSFLSQMKIPTLLREKSEVEKLIDQYGQYASLTVPVLKEAELDQSELVIEEQLAKRSNYSEYYASYQSEGNKLYGLLTIPDNAQLGSTPAVVFVHGYIPPNSYQTQQRYVSYVDYLARNGLVVFKIDLRGHDQSEGEATGSYFSDGYVLDTLNAVESLKSLPEVNKEMISLWGHSMAGNVVSRSIAVNPEIHAASIWAGAVYTYQDMNDYGINDNSYQRTDATEERRKQREEMYQKVGDRDSGSLFWELVSPIAWLRNYGGKIQLHHAVNDSTVPIEYSRNLISILENDLVDIELFEYPSGGHDLEGAVFGQAMDRTLSIFTK
jgi:dipeptidyl aminopeptidase/acylaminoacyl peptidase